MELRQRDQRRARDWLSAAGLAVLVGAAFVLIVGVITGAIDTPWLERQTPLLAIDYPIWGLNAVLLGALSGLGLLAQRRRRRQGLGVIYGGGVLAAFSVSCPLCNGLLVAAFGTGGVLNFIEPARPFLGGATALFLGYMTYRRVKAYRAECGSCAAQPMELGAGA